MQFVEYDENWNMMYILSMFFKKETLSNEYFLEKSIVADNTKEKNDFNLYAEGKLPIEKASFKFNITMYNILDEFAAKGYIKRNPEKKEQTITTEGKKLFADYAMRPDFKDLTKIAEIHMFDIHLVDWQKFSRDLIKILTLNQKKYVE